MSVDPALLRRPLSPYDGFELAIGSVLALRWFQIDEHGRLRSVFIGRHIWKPGENVAACHADLSFGMRIFTDLFTPPPRMRPGVRSKSLADDAVEAKVKVEHLTPAVGCGCGFYGFAHGADDGEYNGKGRVLGVIECYGRTVLGTKGVRCEKARVVALAGAPKRTRELYPEAKHYRRSARWMVRRSDLIQPYRKTPETDPHFWGDAS